MSEEEKIYKYLQEKSVNEYPLENEIFAIRNHDFHNLDYAIYVDGYISLDVIKRNIEKQKELEKKDKVIDEMISHIEHTCYYQDDCGNSCDVIQDTCVESDKDCKDCIKQYFYRKVESDE